MTDELDRSAPLGSKAVTDDRELRKLLALARAMGSSKEEIDEIISDYQQRLNKD